MKNVHIYRFLSLIFIVTILFTSSCSKDQSERGAKGVSSEEILVTGSDESPDTKTSLNGLVTSWKEGIDTIGIFSAEALYYPDEFDRTYTEQVKNNAYIANSSGRSSTFNPKNTMYWGTSYASHTFYSYYPYVTGWLEAEYVPISLPDTQTQSSANNASHLGALDFLVATPLKVYSTAKKQKTSGINLKYNHVFSILEFQIKGSGNLEAISLESLNALAFSNGSINITAAKPASGVPYLVSIPTGAEKKKVTTTLTTSAQLTGTNTNTKVYMVIYPSSLLEQKLCLIGLKIDGTWKYVEKRNPEGGFKRGIKYIVTIDAANAVENVVLGQAGRIWMDRNLGATRVATAQNDIQAYGDLYQFGRNTDGHEKRTSTTTTTRSDTDTPGHNQFIIPPSGETDWRSTTNYNLWQGVSGINNPCPAGFRLPTVSEFNAEHAFWYTGQVLKNAFEGPLKLTAGGYRYYKDAVIKSAAKSTGVLSTDAGYYWTSDRPSWTSSFPGTSIHYISISSQSYVEGAWYRAYGYSVRCIKEQ